LAAVAAAALVAGCSSSSAEADAATCLTGRRVIAPPAAGATYLGAFPFLGNSEDEVSGAAIDGFERLQERDLGWVYFSDNWTSGIRFPTAAVKTIRTRGAVPFIRMMPRTTFDQYQVDPKYSMASIVSGRYDRQLRAWGRAAAKAKGPLMVEFGTEVNGAWFPWNGKWNGGATKTRYGSPRWPDGPERFRDAYRRIVRLTRAAGATNVTWVFHVDASPEPAAAWNAARWYYPGDAYVDWIGLSAYGPQTADEELEQFDDVFAPGYRAAAALSKARPLALLEFAIADGPKWDEAAWTRDAFTALESGRYPRVRGVAWWHERWINEDESVSDLRIDSSPEQLRAYRDAVATSRYTTKLQTRCVRGSG
ncbi:MAG: hypothetical protein JWM90_292, partial [Thermoleophilia bacterium]|nr:hypothetical protein [Thermoleophilia bacterium]